MTARVGDRVIHRVRISASDAHYGGGLVDGAHVMKLFGDVATELLIRSDGREGLLRAYQTVDFLAPVFAGDILEISCELTQVGNTSRQMIWQAHKVIAGSRDPAKSDLGEVLKTPILVAQAQGTCVVKNA